MLESWEMLKFIRTLDYAVKTIQAQSISAIAQILGSEVSIIV